MPPRVSRLLLSLICLTLAACSSTSTPPAAPTRAAQAVPTAAPPTAVVSSPTPAPTMPPLPTATPFGGGRPVAMSIPAINIKDAAIVDLGLDANGAMETPRGWNDIGWYKLGPTPGENGSAVLTGHYDSRTGPAIFFNLHRLKKGDKVTVKLADGSTRSFAVDKAEVYPFDRPPLDRIFAQGDQPTLNLVTCDGTFDQTTANYNKRLVVYTVATP